MDKRIPTFFLVCTALVLSVFLFTKNAKSANTDIIITEIGAYESSGHEWVEIYNKGTESVDMSGWTFWEAETNHGLELVQGDDTLIEPDEYAIITQNDLNFVADYASSTASSTIFDSSWGSLKESGEEIGLKDADGNMVEQFTYISAPDFSLERKQLDAADYSESNWIEHPNGNSVGAQNYWHIGANPDPEPIENIPPTAVFSAPTSTLVDTQIVFDASSSTDSDGSIVSYDWDLGDGGLSQSVSTTYTYTATGTFSILLQVTDDDNATSTASSTITVTAPAPEPEEVPEEKAEIHIVINEFLPNPTSGHKEWIELYNTATTTASLSGITIEDGTGTIAAPTSTIPGGGFFTITLPSSKLNNSGDIIIVKNSDGDIIDHVTYGDWEDSNTEDNADVPEQGQSLARVTDGYDSDMDHLDFEKTDTPTPSESNSIEIIFEDQEEYQQENNNQEQSSAPPNTPTYNESDIVINELVSDPADGYDEFVELYNKTGAPIDLNDWWIEEGSGAKTTLTNIIAAHSFTVIEKPKGNLNNSGDIVRLFAPTGSLIDSVVYGNYESGSAGDNAPRADDPLSLARLYDGKDTNTDTADFALTQMVTRGASNSIVKPKEEEEAVKEEEKTKQEPMDYPEYIQITEIFPNPAGSDAEDEFIEIHNTGPNHIDLDGWKLGDGSTRRYTFSNVTVDPDEYFVIDRRSSGIALNNSGSESVTLIAPNGNQIDSVRYESDAPENESYARRADNRWSWTTKSTPGEENIFEIKKEASDVVPEVKTEDTQKEVERGAEDADVSVITLSEFLPNPNGSDSAEFIEIYNAGSFSIDLAGLKLDDEDGGSKPFTIPEGTIVPPKTYYVFPREQTKLALNNSGDSVRILRSSGEPIESVSYNTLPEGTSYAKNEDDEWLATGSPSPGQENMFSVPKAVAGEKIEDDTKAATSVSIGDARQMDIGDRISTVGTVIVKPGVLGSQFFYIAEATASSTDGIQIYMYSKNFPELAIGDMVEVTGELAESRGELRLKISDQEGIRLIDHVGQPLPTPVEIVSIGEAMEGSFVAVAGEITELKGSHMYIDDGSAEVKVYFKSGAGIDKKAFVVGDLVSVSGIVSQSNEVYQLLPRDDGDVTKTGVTEEVVEVIQEEKTKASKETVEKYLTATAGGLTAILFGLLLKSRAETLFLFLKKRFSRKNK